MLTLRHRGTVSSAFDSNRALTATLNEMRDLAASSRIISYTTRGPAAAPPEYTVEIRVRSPSKVARNGTPTHADVFRLDVRLLKDFPLSAPVCIIASDSATPFHPHFTPRRPFRRSRWIDYRGGVANETLAALVSRIALSLQYQPEHVNASAPRIANARALTWYSLSCLQHPEWFPTDRSLIEERPRAAATDRRRLAMIEGRDGERRTGNKRFEIAATTPEYEVQAKALDSSLRAFGLRSYASAESATSHELYLHPCAARVLLEHVEWGRETEKNRVEQGGLLLGQVFADPESGKVYGVVGAVIPGARAKGSGAYLLMDHDTWKEMIDRADELNATAGDTAMQVIGWYHTHPNELSVFLSGTDRATQARMFAKSWQFAIVLNPQREQWRVFHGADAVECIGFMPAQQ